MKIGGEGGIWAEKETRRERGEQDQVLKGRGNRTKVLRASRKNGNQKPQEVGVKEFS